MPKREVTSRRDPQAERGVFAGHHDRGERPARLHLRHDRAPAGRHHRRHRRHHAQTRQVCENIKAAVEAAGGTLDDVCRVDVYVRNMEHFEEIHEVRTQYFKPPLPASTMVEVTKMTSPDYLIEINAIAVVANEQSTPGRAEPCGQDRNCGRPPRSGITLGEIGQRIVLENEHVRVWE